MKKYGKIILAGGTGQLGSALATYYKHRCGDIVILSRKAKAAHENVRTVQWDGCNQGTWSAELENADLLVNLTGKNVNCRYTQRNKQEIFDSRTQAIKALATASANCNVAPKVWIQFASATIYRHAEDRPMTEADGEIGTGFSVDVCKLWENTFYESTRPLLHTRKLVLRTSLVLSNDDGVFPRLKNLIRMGLGGRQGKGTQLVSWIHEQDVCAISEWLLNNAAVQGIYNCTAPQPLNNTEFMKTLRSVLKMPIALPAPKWLLEMGAFLIRTETELVLKSRWVLPHKLLAEGYRFAYPNLQQAAEQFVKGEHNHV